MRASVALPSVLTLCWLNACDAETTDLRTAGDAGPAEMTESTIEVPGGPLGQQMAPFCRRLIQPSADGRVLREDRPLAPLKLCIGEDGREELNAELAAIQDRLALIRASLSRSGSCK